jgi:hypothetical protein
VRASGRPADADAPAAVERPVAGARDRKPSRIDAPVLSAEHAFDGKHAVGTFLHSAWRRAVQPGRFKAVLAHPFHPMSP